MPRFELTAPDGAKYELQAPDEGAALEAFQKFSGGPAAAPEGDKPAAYDKNDPALQNQAVRSFLRGVPVLGAGANKLAAGLRTAVNGGNYADNLAQEDAAGEDYAKDHSTKDTLMGMLGGTAALGGAAGAIPKVAVALGMGGGPLIPAMTRGAVSGYGLGAADSALRGGDAASGGMVGGITGAGGVLGGKVLGKTFDAMRGRPAGPPVQGHVLDVNGVAVPVTESTLTRNPDTAGKEQGALRGINGGPAQQVATAAREQTQAAMDTAHENFGRGLDPSMPPEAPRPTPEVAAQTVGTDLVAQEQQRAAAEAARIANVNLERAGLKGSMEPPAPAPDPIAAPPPPRAPVPDAPLLAGQMVQEGLQARAAAAKDAVGQNFDALRASQGEFSPAMFTGAPNAIRDNLHNSRDPVRVNDSLTQRTAEGLRVVDEQLGQMRFDDMTRRGEMVRGPDGRLVPRPITADDVEFVRKTLSNLRSDAQAVARSGGSGEDARAMTRLVQEFNDHIVRGVKAGGFSGDGEAYLAATAKARQSHADYRNTFSKNGPGDKVGGTIEEIIGKRGGVAMEPGQIVQKLFGSDGQGGLSHATSVVQRLKSIFGEGSPEWAALRKATMTHLTEATEGSKPLTHVEQADRLVTFLSSPRTTMVAQTLWTPAERANLRSFTASLRAAVDAEPKTGAEKLIARLSGRDGSPPASTTEVVNQLFNSAANKETAVQLARELKTRLTPESWAQVKQGMWSKISEAPEGMTKWESQKISQSIHNFLKSELANTIFTPNERMMMRNIANAHSKLIPVPGTTNPAGTAPMLHRGLKAMQGQLFALFGFAHGGIPGAATAMAASKALTWKMDRNAAKKAVELFHGKQPKRAPGTVVPNTAALLAQATIGDRNHQSR